MLYADIESRVAEKVNAMYRMNSQRVRVSAAIGLSAVVVIGYLARERVRGAASRQAAEVMSGTLKHEGLQVQTTELASLIVMQVLDDPDVRAKTAALLRDAADHDDTRAALGALVANALAHGDTRAAARALARDVVAELAAEPATRARLGALLQDVLELPELRAAAAGLVAALCAEPEVRSAALELVVALLQEDEVRDAARALLVSTSHRVLENAEVVEHSKQFVAHVARDDSVRRSGGSALRASLSYGLLPSASTVALTVTTIGVGLAAAFAQGGLRR